MVKQVREHRWSLDACVGYARLHGLFEADETVCTKTLYNALRAGRMPLTPFELPEMLKRKPRTPKNHVNKRHLSRAQRMLICSQTIIASIRATTTVGRATHRSQTESGILSVKKTRVRCKVE